MFPHRILLPRRFYRPLLLRTEGSVRVWQSTRFFLFAVSKKSWICLEGKINDPLLVQLLGIGRLMGFLK